MFQTAKKLISFVCALIMVIVVFTFPSYATNEEQENNWNIVLVIDGSASLWSGSLNSDPDGLRYEAISSLLDVLSDGTNVGAIVFTANQSASTSPEAMYSGIAENTGISPIETDEDREILMNRIMDAKKDYSNTPQTDIGTALYVATEELLQMNNGRKSAIFLFTDGSMEVNKMIEEKAQQNKNEAIERIQKNDIALCGVFLNKNDLLDSRDVEQIVCDAYQVPLGQRLGDRYVKITDSASIMDCTDAFMRILGYSISDIPEIYEIIYESTDRSFRIPGVGVDEASIRIRTVKGEPIPAGTEVTVYRPNGNRAEPTDNDVSFKTGRAYQIIKIKNPESGSWKVHVELPEGNKIGILYTPIFNVGVEAEMVTVPDTDQLHANMNADIQAFLTKNGVKLTEARMYNEYSCALVLTDAFTGQEQRFEIIPDGNSSYRYTLPLEYGTFDAMIEFSCDQLSVRSQSQVWAFENHAPVVNYSPSLNIKVGLMQSGIVTANLKGIATDLEDGDALTYTIVGGSCDTRAATVSGDTLTVNGNRSGKGTLTLRASDSHGAFVDFDIHVTTKNFTPIVILLLCILLVLLVCLVLLVVYLKNIRIPKGDCEVEFELRDVPDAFGDMSQMDFSFVVPVPRTKKLPGRTTLHAMILYDLNDDSGNIKSNCHNDPQTEGFIRDLVEKKFDAKLKSIRVSNTLTKKKKPALLIQDTERNEKKVLYGDSYSVDLDMEGSISIAYLPPEEEDFEETDNGFDGGTTSEYDFEVDTDETFSGRGRSENKRTSRSTKAKNRPIPGTSDDFSEDFGSDDFF